MHFDHSKISFGSLPYSWQKRILAFAFLLMPLVLVITFVYLPAINMVGYSFTNWDGTAKVKTFVGLKNYQTIFADPQKYFNPLKVSLYYFVGSFFQIGLALLIATILTGKVVGKNIFKGIYFFPSLINGVAIGFIFLFFFQPGGTFDSFLKLIGMGNLTMYWLRMPTSANISLAFVSVWRYIGFNIVMFSAAIQSISPDIFEASEIDGANRFQQFKSIIVPGISTILGLNLFLSITGALTVFEIPYIMTGGGNGTETFVIQAINIAFKNRSVGLASALAIVLMFIVIGLSLIQRIVFRKRGD